MHDTAPTLPLDDVVQHAKQRRKADALEDVLDYLDRHRLDYALQPQRDHGGRSNRWSVTARDQRVRFAQPCADRGDCFLKGVRDEEEATCGTCEFVKAQRCGLG